MVDGAVDSAGSEVTGTIHGGVLFAVWRKRVTGERSTGETMRQEVINCRN